MGLFGMLNKVSGYSEENMAKSFHEVLPAIGSKAVCSLGVSLRTRIGLLKSKATVSGFAAITDTKLLVLYAVIPFKSAAIYGLTTAKKLTVKNHIAGQKIVEGAFFNIRSQEFDDLILQIAPEIDGFPHQSSNFEYFISMLESYKTE